MNKETADFLVEAADQANMICRLDESYSGRSMYGATTHGIIVDNERQLLAAAVSLAYEQGRQEGEASVEDEEQDENLYDMEAIVRDLRGLRIDNVGRSFILY